MLQTCFYLLAVLTTVVSLTFSNVNLVPDGATYNFNGVSLKLRNIAPQSVDLPATNFSSTADALSFTFNTPLTASLTLQVWTLFFYTPSKLELSVAGSASYKKNATNGCDYPSLTQDYCDLKAKLVIRGYATNVVLLNTEMDACSLVEGTLLPLLQPPPTVGLPVVAKGATDIAKVLYFRKLTLLNGLNSLLNNPSSTRFLSRNAMRVTKALPLPLNLAVDTADPLASVTFTIVSGVSAALQQLFNVTLYNNETDSTVTLQYQGGTVTMPSFKNLVEQLVSKNAHAALSTHVPAGAALVYDVVVNDLQCRMFNTICTIPAENGVQVINAHFVGLGDFNGLLGNTFGDALNAALTDTVSLMVKKTSRLSRGRYYLPLF